MASNVLTYDEQYTKMARQVEQLIVTTVRQNNAIERPAALKMLAKICLKKATQPNMRPIVEPTAIATV